MRYWLLVLPLVAAGSVWAESFELRANVPDGPVTLHNPQGGRYVYGPPVDDGRVATPPILLRPIPTQEYEYFSPEEIEGMSKLLNRGRKSARRGGKVVDPYAGLNWPKVVIRGNEICVPERTWSKSPDWKAHLVCTDRKAAVVTPTLAQDSEKSSAVVQPMTQGVGAGSNSAAVQPATIPQGVTAGSNAAVAKSAESQQNSVVMPQHPLVTPIGGGKP